MEKKIIEVLEQLVNSVQEIEKRTRKSPSENFVETEIQKELREIKWKIQDLSR